MISINRYCPHSGKPVSADSLTEYRGFTVGFCNPGCRDDFAANPGKFPGDIGYFDALIKEHRPERNNPQAEQSLQPSSTSAPSGSVSPPPMLKVYLFDRSPFCIAIVQATHAGGLAPELVHVSNADRSELIRFTNGSSYQVPVLADGDRLICESGPDSQDIAAYLDTHYLQGRLFPAALQGWQTIINQYIENTVEAVTFKVCDAAVIPTVEDVVERTLLIRHKERKFGVGCVERWQRERPEMIAEANRLLLPFEQTLANAGGPYLFGHLPVYSDFLLYGILGNYTYRDTLAFPSELPALRAWRDRLQSFRF